jgi:AcrR family transcriptional regulator
MNPVKTDTRTAILENALDLLLSRSWSGFSYQDLSERLGITKASIHYHFRTKEDLGVALLEMFASGGEFCVGDRVGRCTPRESLDAFFGMAGEMLAPTGKICPVGALQAEYSVIPDRVRAKLDEVCRQHAEKLAEALEEARSQDLVSFQGTAVDQASMLTSAVQGALQQSRHRGPEHYQRVVEQLKSSMGLK